MLFHLAAGDHIHGLLAVLPSTFRLAVFDYGYLGVAAFFVLSGFVMALNTARVTATATFTARFIARRLVRLTPPYYAAILLALSFLLIENLWFNGAEPMPSAMNLAAHAIYLQDMLRYPQINDVFWTLCVEVQFYLVFALLLWLVQRLGRDRSLDMRRMLVLWIGGLLTMALPMDFIQGPVWTGSFLPYWYSFVAGAVVSWGCLHRGRALWFAWTYCAATAVLGWISADKFAVVSCATALLLLLASLTGGMARWLNFRWARSLGLVSYSLYLIHNNVIGATFRVTDLLLPSGLATQIISAALALLACLILAGIMFRCIEQPCIDWSRHISVRKR